MATPRAVRIPKSPAVGAESPDLRPTSEEFAGPLPEFRRNEGGSQRVVRLTVIFLVLLVALYAGFLSYALASPWGGSSAVGNGLLLFTGIFVVFAAVGALYTLTAAPRGVEVRGDRITVVGRWGNRRSYPSLERLNVRVVRSYRPGILSNRVVELVEVAGEDAPTRSFVAEADLFRGSMPVPRVR